MKKLYLIRHAKSDWSIIGQSDFDRSLNQRGKYDAKKIGEKLKDLHITPDKILSSPAIRAQKTIQKICKKISFKKKDIEFHQEIYDTHMQWYTGALACIMEQSEDINELFFVGHNDAITQLAEYLSWQYIGNMPTCSVLCLSFLVDTWEDISYDTWDIEFFLTPKDLQHEMVS